MEGFGNSFDGGLGLCDCEGGEEERECLGDWLRRMRRGKVW